MLSFNTAQGLLHKKYFYRNFRIQFGSLYADSWWDAWNAEKILEDHLWEEKHHGLDDIFEEGYSGEKDSEILQEKAKPDASKLHLWSEGWSGWGGPEDGGAEERVQQHDRKPKGSVFRKENISWGSLKVKSNFTELQFQQKIVKDKISIISFYKIIKINFIWINQIETFQWNKPTNRIQ